MKLGWVALQTAVQFIAEKQLTRAYLKDERKRIHIHFKLGFLMEVEPLRVFQWWEMKHHAQVHTASLGRE